MTLREDRIAELEAKLARPSSVGVRPLVAILGILTALYFLFTLRSDLAYALSPRKPIALGTEGNYRLEELRSNRFAELHGTPTRRGAFFRDGDETFVVVGILDTPVLVLRRALPTEVWSGKGLPPPPDPRPFGVLGRLLARASASQYADGFARLEGMAEVKPAWLVVAGEAPGADATPLFVATGLLTFLAFNVFLLLRRRRPEAA